MKMCQKDNRKSEKNLNQLILSVDKNYFYCI